MKCKWHLCDNNLSGRQTSFCSIKCKNKMGATEARRRIKKTLVEEFGNKCIDCGYEGPPFMYDFDHRLPEEKSFGIARKGITHSMDTLRKEAKKCDLVCANCHRFRTHKQRCSGCIYCKTFSNNSTAE